MDKAIEYFKGLDKVSHLAITVAIVAAVYLLMSSLTGSFILYFWELVASLVAFSSLGVFAWHQVFGPHKMFTKMYQLLFALTGDESFKPNTKVLNDGKEKDPEPGCLGIPEQVERAKAEPESKPAPTNPPLAGDAFHY